MTRAHNFFLYIFGKIVATLIFRLFCHVEIVNRNIVPRRGPLLAVSNHISYFDPPLIGAFFPRAVQFMTLAELFRKPWSARFFRALGSFPVDRSKPDARAAREAVRRIKAGGCVVIFPEGGIRKGEKSILEGSEELKEGAALVALMAEAPIQPVIIEGARQLYEKKNWLRRPKIRIIFGAPFSLCIEKHLTNVQRRRQASDMIRAQLLATARATAPP
jgi:1-acyl-sn-glycerol-3-phosphate acyltransferase